MGADRRAPNVHRLAKFSTNGKRCGRTLVFVRAKTESAALTEILSAVFYAISRVREDSDFVGSFLALLCVIAPVLSQITCFFLWLQEGEIGDDKAINTVTKIRVPIKGAKCHTCVFGCL